MKRATEFSFKTEADLCDAFLAWVKRQGPWTPYPETAGWDILLVHPDGTQVGIQAKLRFNIAVLEQCVEGGLWVQEVGPDFRAVLVPEWAGSVNLCDALGFTLIRARAEWINNYKDKVVGFEPDFRGTGWQRWHYMNPRKRHELPEYVPDVRAGVPAPAQLTKWKIAALEICALLELRGFVIRDDFREAGIDHRRWVEAWLEPMPDRAGAWRWRDGDQFSAQHPTIYAQVREKVKKRGYLLPELDLAGPTRLK